MTFRQPFMLRIKKFCSILSPTSPFPAASSMHVLLLVVETVPAVVHLGSSIHPRGGGWPVAPSTAEGIGTLPRFIQAKEADAATVVRNTIYCKRASPRSSRQGCSSRHKSRV